MANPFLFGDPGQAVQPPPNEPPNPFLMDTTANNAAAVAANPFMMQQQGFYAAPQAVVAPMAPNAQMEAANPFAAFGAAAFAGFGHGQQS